MSDSPKINNKQETGLRQIENSEPHKEEKK